MAARDDVAAGETDYRSVQTARPEPRGVAAARISMMFERRPRGSTPRVVASWQSLSAGLTRVLAPPLQRHSRFHVEPEAFPLCLFGSEVPFPQITVGRR